MHAPKEQPGGPTSAPGGDAAQEQLPFSPAAQRNAPFILAVLQQALPMRARILEVASGTGQHARHFASSQPHWTWQATEAQAEALPVLAARAAGLPNMMPPRLLDVLGPPDRVLQPGLEPFDAVYVANLLHIAPWAATAGLFRLAAAYLVPQGQLLVYGPFQEEGLPLAPGNAAFDADLRQRDPRWGLRELEKVKAEAKASGFRLAQRHEMPANNLLLCFEFEGRAG